VPRFDVFVPRSTGALLALAAALPRRGRDGLARLLRADRAAAAADRAHRAAYEARAAASAPAAERVVEAHELPADEPREPTAA
jgi:hypothetical protein